MMHRAETGRPARTELKALVADASRALALLDAPRLKELAASCQALNRELMAKPAEERAALTREAGEAAGEMAILARVLEATRANLRVMHKLREMQAARIEYTERQARGGMGLEREHGDD